MAKMKSWIVSYDLSSLLRFSMLSLSSFIFVYRNLFKVLLHYVWNLRIKGKNLQIKQVLKPCYLEGHETSQEM